MVAATPNGAPIEILVVDPTYPLPPLTTVIADIVPKEDTVAVRVAATGFTSLTMRAPKLLITNDELSSSYSKNWASSTKILSDTLVYRLPIIIAVGNIIV